MDGGRKSPSKGFHQETLYANGNLAGELVLNTQLLLDQGIAQDPPNLTGVLMCQT